MAFINRYSLVCFGVMLAGIGAWFALWPGRSQDAGPAAQQLPDTREAVEALLTPCLGQTVREVVEMLGLGAAERLWTDEPPGILRGASYHTANGRSVTLYIAPREPLFRQFSERRDWNYEAFLGCRVGGIHYEANGLRGRPRASRAVALIAIVTRGHESRGHVGYRRCDAGSCVA